MKPFLLAGGRTLLLLAWLLCSLAGCDRYAPRDDIDDARAAIAARDWLEAEKLLERYLRLAPQGSQRWEAWNELYAITNRVRSDDRASADMLEAMLLEFGTDPARARDILSRLGDAFEASYRYDRAAATWRTLLSVPALPADEMARVYRRLARIQVKLRRYDMAQDLLQSCVELEIAEARRAECVYDMADANLALEHLDKAAQLARQVVDMDGTEETTRAMAGFLLGDVLEQKGKFGEALQAFEAIKNIYPNELVIQNRITYLKKKTTR